MEMFKHKNFKEDQIQVLDENSFDSIQIIQEDILIKISNTL